MIIAIDFLSWDEIVKVYLSTHRLEFLLLFGIAVALALIIVTILVLMITRPRRASLEPSIVPPKSHRNVRKPLLIVLSLSVGAVALGALAAVLSGPATGTAFCRSCHRDRLGTSWLEYSHKDVACRDCHLEPGTLGYIKAQAQIGRMWLSKNSPLQLKVAWPQRAAACVACHQNVDKGATADDGSHLSHREIISRKIKCLDCHPDVDHHRPK